GDGEGSRAGGGPGAGGDRRSGRCGRNPRGGSRCRRAHGRRGGGGTGRIRPRGKARRGGGSNDRALRRKRGFLPDLRTGRRGRREETELGGRPEQRGRGGVGRRSTRRCPPGEKGGGGRGSNPRAV